MSCVHPGGHMHAHMHPKHSICGWLKYMDKCMRCVCVVSCIFRISVTGIYQYVSPGESAGAHTWKIKHAFLLLFWVWEGEGNKKKLVPQQYVQTVVSLDRCTRSDRSAIAWLNLESATPHCYQIFYERARGWFRKMAEVSLQNKFARYTLSFRSVICSWKYFMVLLVLLCILCMLY